VGGTAAAASARFGAMPLPAKRGRVLFRPKLDAAALAGSDSDEDKVRKRERERERER
jgi:hypothetical protein